MVNNKTPNYFFRKKLPLPIIIFSFFIVVFAYNASAEENNIRKMMFGISGGPGYSKYNINKKEASGYHYALASQIGYKITPRITLGLEGNYLVIQETDSYTTTHSTAHWYDYIFFDPNGEDYDRFHYNTYHEGSKGENITNVSLFANVFPFYDSRFYLTGGGGGAFYKIIINSKKFRDDGWAGFIGCGYEFVPMKDLYIGPEFRYCRGSFSNWDYSFSELSVIWRFYF